MTIRSTAKHRGQTPKQLRAQITQQDCEFTKLHLHFEELGAAYKRLEQHCADQQTRLQQATVERDAAVIRAESAAARVADLEAQVRRLTADCTGLRAQRIPRDTKDVRDRATVPMDMRTLRAEIADDFLDRTRVAWTPPVTPLWQAPFAMDRPPVSPTSLPGDKTTTTLHLGRTAA